MATPVSSSYSRLNIVTKSYDIGPGSLSDPSSLQYAPTLEASYSSSPFHQNKDRSSSNASLSSSSFNKKSTRNSGKKQIYLDISGPFPYFDSELKEEKEAESDTEDDRELTKHEISKLEKQTLQSHGYIRTKNSFIATTLQGEVFKGKLINNTTTENTTVVIKKTSKKLHKLGITVTKSGKVIKVKENIVEEAELMKKFSNNNPPTSLIKYYDFIEDSHYYYLIMENGGTDFFDFVVKCHDLILNGKLKLSEWRKHCKHMFAQMIRFIRWMHNKMNCCYLDISLENMLISENVKFDENTGKLSMCYIKFVDFGLTQFFDVNKNPNFICEKYVGKTHYKAPKVYNKQPYCANKADVYSLGVCLFMCAIGAPPYNKPIEKDITYNYIKYGHIAKLLKEWGRIKYVTSNLHDLITKMLTFDQSQRITLDEIIQHKWIQHYFATEQINNIPQTDDESLPPQTPQISENHSASVSLIQTYIHNNTCNNNQKINPMIPQQCISYSISRKSVSHSASSYIYSPNNRHRYSTPYTPYTPTPTPIIQSHTSNHDHAFFLAAIDDKKNKSKKQRSKSVVNRKQKVKKNKKIKKTFFKLFG